MVSGQRDGNESDRIKKDKLALTLSLFTYRKLTQQQIEEQKKKEAQMQFLKEQEEEMRIQNEERQRQI
jgi:hypothetical protein